MKVKVVYFLPFFLLFATNHSMAQYTFTGIDVYPLPGNCIVKNFPLDSSRIMSFSLDSANSQSRYTLYDSNFNQISSNLFPSNLPTVMYWGSNFYKVDANGGSYFLIHQNNGLGSFYYCKFDFGGNLEWITAVNLPNYCNDPSCSPIFVPTPFAIDITDNHDLVIAYTDSLNGLTLTVVDNSGTLITQTCIAGLISANEKFSPHCNYSYSGNYNFMYNINNNKLLQIDQNANVYLCTDSTVIIDSTLQYFEADVTRFIYKIDKHGNLIWKKSMEFIQSNEDHEFESITEIRIAGDTVIIGGIHYRQFLIPYFNSYIDSYYVKSFACLLDFGGNILYNYISTDSVGNTWTLDDLFYEGPIYLGRNNIGEFIFLDLIDNYFIEKIYGLSIKSINNTNYTTTQIADISAQFALNSYCDQIYNLEFINFIQDPAGNYSIMIKLEYVQNNCTDYVYENLYFQFSPSGTLLHSEILNENFLPLRVGSILLQNKNILRRFISVCNQCANCNSATYDFCFDCIASVEGEIYYDAFNNCQNFNEPPTANSLISFDNGQHLQFTNSIGVYNAFLDSGPHTIEPLPTFPYWFSNCQTLPMNLSAPAYPNTSMGNDMALALLPNVEDVVIWNHNYPMRPGFDGQTVIQLQNLSTVQANGTLRIDYPDSIFTYLNATPQPDTVGVGYLAWNYVNMPLFSQNNFNIMWNIPSSIPINTPFNFDITAGNLMTDTTPANNVINYTGLINGSFDPNDKQVSPAGIGPEGFISQQDSLLTYLVRFQNTGTDTAFTVKIEDIIDDELNLASISIDFATHPYSVELKNRKLVVTFSNILLPDSGTNYANSMGAIQYSIKLKPNLFPGTEIKNVAAIYFDFNAPVITNTVTNTIATVTSVQHLESEVNTFLIYPNPFDDKLLLSWSNKNQIHSLELYTLFGQRVVNIPVNSKNADQNKMDLSAYISGLNKGIYFLKIFSDSGTEVKKLIKQ